MIIKKELRIPILSLFLLSIGGWFLHLRIHPVTENPSYYIPFIFGILNVFIVPFLFHFKKTVIIAYLINGFGVIMGVITMAHLSITGLEPPFTFTIIFIKTTLADIFILLPKLFIAHTILLHYFPSGLGRFFTLGWWLRHFGYLTIVYICGHFLGS